MTILVVCGLLREARLIRGAGITTIVGGGDAAALAGKIQMALTPETRGIISFGIAGALAPMLRVGDCVIASEVVAPGERVAADERWAASLIDQIGDAAFGTIAGADWIADTPEMKAEMFSESGALAIDLESHVAARTARDCQLPFAALRVISDDATTSLPPAALVAMKPNGGIAYGRVMKSVAMRPQQIPHLLRTARSSERAFAGLLRRRHLAGPLLGFPDLG